METPVTFPIPPLPCSQTHLAGAQEQKFREERKEEILVFILACWSGVTASSA